MEELVARHDPVVVAQVKSCTGTEHAMHREASGLVLHYCNCGYTSGWVPAETLPTPAAFIAEHPPYFRAQGDH